MLQIQLAFLLFAPRNKACCHNQSDANYLKYDILLTNDILHNIGSPLRQKTLFVSFVVIKVYCFVWVFHN